MIFYASGDGENVASCIAQLGPELAKLRLSESSRTQLTADLVVAVKSRALGFVVDVTPSDVAALAAAGCGLVVDTYSDEEDGGSGG